MTAAEWEGKKVFTMRVKEHRHIVLVHGKGEEGSPHSPQHFCAHASVQVSVQVVLLAEFVCKGDAREKFAPVALDGVDVKEHHETGEEADKHQQEDDDLTAFAVQVHAAEADVR